MNYKGKRILIKGTSFPLNSQPACIVANNKYLSKKVLRRMGLPIPRSFLVRNATDVKQLVIKHQLFPCVLKPSQGAHGRQVFANIESLEELEAILPQLFATRLEEGYLLEEYIAGIDYRVLVVGDKVSAVMERIPAHVIGDGLHTIKQLVAIYNQNPLVGKKYEKPMCRIVLSGEVIRNLRKKKRKLTDVPEKGEQVFLRQNANISTGGIGKDATEQAPQIVKTTAIKAARAIGLNITGVDIMYHRLKRIPYILELNDQPGIDIHHHPAVGQAHNVAGDIIAYLLNTKAKNQQPVTKTSNNVMFLEDPINPN